MRLDARARVPHRTWLCPRTRTSAARVCAIRAHGYAPHLPPRGTGHATRSAWCGAARAASDHCVAARGARGEGRFRDGGGKGGVAAGSEAGRTAPLCAAPRTHVPHAGLHCTWLRYVRWWRNGPPRCASAPPRHMNGPRLCGVVCVRHGARARATRHAWRMPGTRASTIRMCAMRAHGCATRPRSEAQAAWCDRHGGARRALRAATARGQRRTKSAVGCARQGQPTG